MYRATVYVLDDTATKSCIPLCIVHVEARALRVALRNAKRPISFSLLSSRFRLRASFRSLRYWRVTSI